MSKIFAVLFLFPCVAQAALVSGQIRNAAPGALLEVLVPHRYIDGQDGRYRAEVNKQSQFSVAVEVPEPQLVFVLFNDERLPIFLAQDDTLILRVDAFQFPLAVNFNGPAAANNRLLQEYLRLIPLDFNEFNNIRFKIGRYWTAIEMAMNEQMESSPPESYRAYLDTLRLGCVTLFEKSEQQFPGEFTGEFLQWLNADITYFWAYHLLLYGQVYGARHALLPDFFDFLYEAPTISEAMGSEWYRQFLLVFLSRQQLRLSQEATDFWPGLYHLSGRLLSGKPLAFLRSELIATAFSAEEYRELLPLYTDFLQSNESTEYPAYDAKVEGLYQKYARVLPGTPAPRFVGKDFYGVEISLEQLRGKVVYLNFWASWCGACLRKMEIMDGFAAEFLAKGIEVVNISIDENEWLWGNSLAGHGFSGRHVLSSTGNIAKLYGVEAVPQYFIIGRNGLFVDKANAHQPMEIREQLLKTAEK